MEDNYLQSIKKQFEYYKMLGDRTFTQVDEKIIFKKFNENSNSIAILVKHLWGNMLSRWTDFMHSDGEKSFRDRDSEFENDIKNKKELLEKWEEGWNCLFHAIDTLSSEDLNKIIYIRNQGHTVIEALNRQLAHYSYHMGQIIFIAKMLMEDDWVTLTIPKGNSKMYNAHKFSKTKENIHFTDEYINFKKK